ncbi:MFS transporter [Streptantibioticus rubrisoli]|uniref:MFS transporter n=1 Tax=Streptantibioticus rubrisoli TaxID=1387313 RepID=A0ABT1P599_9ACTN|nr:MFS transporter [Streptantibioticus rubrisoli]MCQ4040539.1 MFS transporter [Streptantibioticus rubrisoli]
MVDGYTLVFACLMLLCGALGDRFGHRRAFLAGLVVFTVASAACGAATSAWQLIAARLLQGAGAALMVPASLALLRAAYPEPAARARAFGVWGAVSGLGAAAGPVIGGLAVWGVSWRAVFLVNIPFGLLATALTWRCVPAPRPHPGARLRLPVQLLGVAALAALTTALNGGGTRGWTDPLVLGCLGGAAAAGGTCAVLLRPSADEARPSRAQRRGLTGAATVGLLLNLGAVTAAVTAPGRRG